MGLSPWVPTTDGQIGPWAEEQAKVFASDGIQYGIKEGRKIYASYMNIPAPDGLPLSKEQIQAWAEFYLDTRGFPRDAHGALSMARAFVLANCDSIGLPPEFIVASRLVENFPPATIEDAAVWSAQLASAFLASFGVPIVDSFDASSFLSACARVAVSQTLPGIPFDFFSETFSSLSDGILTGAETKGIVIGAAGYIGAVVGQAFGIPAPIGAMLSQLLVGALVEGLSDLLGWGPTDAEKLKAAQDAASASAAAATARCTDLAVALWLQYQHYWDAIVKDLGASIRASQEWLTPKGVCASPYGIRQFGSTSLDVVFGPNGEPLLDKQSQMRRYPYPVTRSCLDQNGCPYVMTNITGVVQRDKFALSPGELGRMPAIKLGPQGCDATSALAYWNARRYVTPWQVFFAMKGKPLEWLEKSAYIESQLKSRNVHRFEEVLHSDLEYLQVIGAVGTVEFGTKVGQCMAPQWASFMFRSLEQVAAAVALVQRDLARTVSAETTAYGIQYHLDKLAGVQFQAAGITKQRESVRLLAAKTAAMRHAIMEARRRGSRKADLINYGLLAAGSAALFGYGAAKVVK